MLWHYRRLLICSYCIGLFVLNLNAEKSKNKDEEKPAWKKKDIRDYTEADLERLYDEWEDNDDEPLEEDELPEYKRPPPKIDLSKLDTSNPDAMIAATKKGQTLMMFVAVSGKPTRHEAEKITQLWQSSLYNAHYDIQRYMVDDDRAIFMLKDGSRAPEVRDYLVKQERCRDVTIEGQVFPGLGSETKESKSDKTSSKSSNNSGKKKTEL